MNSRFRTYLVIFTAAFALFAAFTATDYGVSWDEPMRWRSGDKKLAYYETLSTSSEKFEVMQHAPDDVYPGLYDIPLALARRAFPEQTYLLSRIWCSVFAYLLLLAPIAMTRILLTRTGKRDEFSDEKGHKDILPFFAALVLFCMPEVNGHLFMNPKDIPFAATYSWGLVALLWALIDLPKVSWKRTLGFGAAMGLAMATRPPGVVLIAYFGLFATLWVVLAAESGSKAKLWLNLSLRGCVSLLVAATVLLPFWPKAHRSLLSPITASTEAANRLQSFSSAQPVLYNGQFYEAGDTPWSYSLWMFVAKQPEWVIALLAVAFVALILALPQTLDRLRQGDRLCWGLALLALATVAPWGYVIASGAAIHNGFRHMFYVLPAIAVFAALSIHWILGKVWETRRWRIGVFAALGLLMSLNLYSIARLYPFQYIYYNALAGGVGGAFGKYETDYWFLGARDGFEILYEEPDTKPMQVYLLGPQEVGEFYLQSHMKLVENPAEATHYIGRPIPGLMAAGRVLGEVDRMGAPLLAVVALDAPQTP